MLLLSTLFLATLASALPQDASSGALASVQKRACAPYAVLFARGTTESAPTGSVVGPQFFKALQEFLPKGTTYTGVSYPADVPGYLMGGGVQGINEMRKQAESAASCGSKLIMSGYSQGAQVTHKAISGGSAKMQAAVVAVVVFGDPLMGQAIKGVSKDKIKTICATGDMICAGAPIIGAAHLGYSSNAGEAAAFVKKAVAAAGPPAGAGAA